MKIVILCFHSKKKLIRTDQFWRNGSLLKLGRNQWKFHFGSPGHPLRWKGVFFVDFHWFRPNFKGLPFRQKWSVRIKFFFKWKQRIKIFIFCRIYTHSPISGRATPVWIFSSKNRLKMAILANMLPLWPNAIFLFLIFLCWNLKGSWRLMWIFIL